MFCVGEQRSSNRYSWFICFFQRVGKFLQAPESLLWILRHCFHYYLLNCLWNSWDFAENRWWRFVIMLVALLNKVAFGKGWCTSEPFVGDDGEGVLVAGGFGFAAKLFGGH